MIIIITIKCIGVYYSAAYMCDTREHTLFAVLHKLK